MMCDADRRVATSQVQLMRVGRETFAARLVFVVGDARRFAHGAINAIIVALFKIAEATAFYGRRPRSALKSDPARR